MPTLRGPHPGYKTRQHLDPDQDAGTQQELREAQWAQDARDLGETDYIRRYYAEKLGLVGCVEMHQMEGDANSGNNYVHQALHIGAVYTILR